ncbi:Lrp4 [Symbiodinium microadriaticum]|nr:Lrp4 [Symbiodinium microadriaticum]
MFKCSVLLRQDESIELEGLKIHGSPLSAGSSPNGAFQSQSGYDEAKAVSAVPEGLDILVTHGPAGEGALGRASACLQERIDEVRPRVHIFGHYHLGHGVACRDGVVQVNASSADAFFAVSNPPIVMDIMLRTFAHVEARHLYLLMNWPDCLMRANLDGTDREVLLSGLGHPNSLAVDDLRQKLYFSESDDTSDRIMRCNLDGSNLEEVVSGVHVQGIATDADGKVYWTDVTSSQIQRSAFNGSDIEVLVSDLQEPAGLALDSKAGRIYWADQCGYENTARIQSAGLDGSGVATLHNASHPMHVALDSDGQLYWTDAGSFEIRRCKPDGSSAEVLYNKTVVLLPNSQPSNKPVQQLTGLLDPQGIAVDSVAGKVYWTQLGTQYKTRGGPSVQRNSKLQRANLDGSEIETLAEFGASQPVAVAISLVPSHKAEL